MPNRYYTTKDQARRAGVVQLGFDAGKGYYDLTVGRPKPAVARAPVDPLTQQATSSVEAALAPVLAALERQREDARQQAAQQQQRLGDYYKWAAGEAKNIGPAIGGAYNQAAQTTGAFGKGFSQGMQDALGGAAAQGNALLAQNGAPAGQQIGGNAAAAGDVLFGLGGAIPGQELSQQGAAFSSAASQLPLTAAGIGGMALQDLQAEGRKAEKEITDQLLDIEAKRPGLINDALNELKQLALDQEKFQFQKDVFEFDSGIKLSDLKRKAQNDKFNQQAKLESLAQGRDRIAISKYNADLGKLQKDRNYQLGLSRLGIQEEGLRLRAQELEARNKQKPSSKKGFTPKQRADLKGIAGNIARHAYRGINDDLATPDKDESLPPVDYQEAVRIGLDEGVPLAILLPALNRYYKKGERGRPHLSIYERRRASKRPKRG